MRATTAIPAAILLSLACATMVMAAPAAVAPKAAAPLEAPAPKLPAGMTDPEDNDEPLPASKAAGGPLLPVRPKDFNPLMPPEPAEGMMGAMQGDIRQMNTANVLVAELRVYVLQLTFFTRWLALVAIVGGVLLALQLFSLRRHAAAAEVLARGAVDNAETASAQLDVMRERSHAELRAYVYPNGAKGEMPKDKSGKYTVRVEVRNFGRTPAHAVSGPMAVFVGDMVHEKDIQFVGGDKDMLQTVLPPGGVCYFYASTFEPVAPEVKAIVASVRAIYAYGEIRYKDIFGNDHCSRFRFKCTGEVNMASNSFDHCASGNDAD